MENNEIYKQEGIKYFAVIYENNGNISLKMFDSEEQAEDSLYLCVKKFRDKIYKTTIIKRDMSKFKDGLLFGYSKSKDAMVSQK